MAGIRTVKIGILSYSKWICDYSSFHYIKLYIEIGLNIKTQYLHIWSTEVIGQLSVSDWDWKIIARPFIVQAKIMEFGKHDRYM